MGVSKRKDGPKIPGARAAHVAQLGIVVLSLGSYALSFEQIFNAARAAGILFGLAIVYGLLLEGFVTLATYTAYVCRGTREACYPWVVAGLAFSFSIVVNFDHTIVPPGVVRALPVVLVPVGVHLLIVLSAAHKRNEAAFLEALATPVPAPAPVIQYVEVPGPEQIITVPAVIDPETVTAADVPKPRAVAFKLLADTSGRAQSRAHYMKQYREALDADNETPTLTLAAA